MKAIRLKPEAAGYVVQLALKATQVPMADTFGPYVQNALNWIYQNGGHFGVAENSALDNYMAHAVMQAQAGNGQRPVQQQPVQIQQVQQPQPRPAPFVQQAPQAVPVHAPLMSQVGQPENVAAVPSGEAPSLTTAPVGPGQDALTNSDAAILG